MVVTARVLSKIKAPHFWYIFVQNNHVWTAAKIYEKTYYTAARLHAAVYT